MFSYLLKEIEEAESLLLELGASGPDLNAKVESIRHTLNPETINVLINVSHAIKLPPQFFSESDTSYLEISISQVVTDLNKQILDKNIKGLKEHIVQTNHLFEPSMFERMKIFFAVDPVAQSRKMEPSKIILINLLKRQSLSCDRCNSLSVPILDTADRYKCIKCERQFISAEHHIRHAILDSFKDNWAAQRLILKHYDECVDRISNQA
ncbi:hypothetical protein SAMN05444507_106360 [Pseudomonas syringae]|uniref:hypothetical protein n=1 Tax=Pseudomonas syringae TaxID=317 RepID=UPI0008EAC5B1|nr:hypothetical protein [Pseudomonas syringae]SFI22720.1 hypothetical protein SAMN05444507_106360 [Pseudomonas syringae]